MLRLMSHSRFASIKSVYTYNCIPKAGQYLWRSIMAQVDASKGETLPLLSRQDRDTYARMENTMEMFHNSFRNTWKILYGACSSGKRPANMSIRQFINTGCDFCHHLHMHHSIGTGGQ